MLFQSEKKKDLFYFFPPLDKLIFEFLIELRHNLMLICYCVPFNIPVSECKAWEDREGIIRDVWALGQRRESEHHMKKTQNWKQGSAAKHMFGEEKHFSSL